MAKEYTGQVIPLPSRKLSGDDAIRQIEMRRNTMGSPKEYTGPVVKPSVPQPAAEPVDIIAGSPPMRFALGAASPFVGGAQLSLNMAGMGEDANKKIDELEASKRRGMQYWKEKTGVTSGPEETDWFGTAGTIMSPPLLAAMKLPAATNLAGKMVQGAGMGGAIGALTPTTGQDYWKSKIAQTGAGTTIGGLTPVAIEAGRTLGRWGGDIADLLTQSGPYNLAVKYIKQLVGKKNIPEVSERLRTSPQYLPKSQTTAAEAVEGVPGGGPIRAYQKRIASTPGGPSAEFEKLDQARKELYNTVKTDLGKQAVKIKDTLAAIDAKGGVLTPTLQHDLINVADAKGLQQNPVVSNVLQDIQQQIESVSQAYRAAGAPASQQYFTIKAMDLGAIRDNLSAIIAKHGGDAQPEVSKILQGKIQNVIDGAMERSGGTGWTKAMGAFQDTSERLAKDMARYKGMYRTKVNLSAHGITDEDIHGLPHILSRPLVAANWVLGLLRGDVRPLIQEQSAMLLQNPTALADALSKSPRISPEMWNEIIKRSSIGESAAIAPMVGKGRKPRPIANP